jgi:hypothetical protein
MLKTGGIKQTSQRARKFQSTEISRERLNFEIITNASKK